MFLVTKARLCFFKTEPRQNLLSSYKIKHELTTNTEWRSPAYSEYHFVVHFQFLKHKVTSEQQPAVNNGLKFRVSNLGSQG